jgi:hypothetical protein
LSRRVTLQRCLRQWLPAIPEWEAGTIIAHCLDSASLRQVAPQGAVRLAAVAFVRHACTDYEALLEQGYGVEAARHFVAATIDEVLAGWGAPAPLCGSGDHDGTQPQVME